MSAASPNAKRWRSRKRSAPSQTGFSKFGDEAADLICGLVESCTRLKFWILQLYAFCSMANIVQHCSMTKYKRRFFSDNMIKVTLQSWIGLSRSSPMEKWKWEDNSSSGYRDWVESAEGNVSCAVASALPGDFYQWRSRDCKDKLYFLCQNRGKSGAGASKGCSTNCGIS